MIHPKACKQPPWQPQLDALDTARRDAAKAKRDRTKAVEKADDVKGLTKVRELLFL